MVVQAKSELEAATLNLDRARRKNLELEHKLQLAEAKVVSAEAKAEKAVQLGHCLSFDSLAMILNAIDALEILQLISSAEL
eukprot:1160877-Pelagomonas_calceolata.AAC.7